MKIWLWAVASLCFCGLLVLGTIQHREVQHWIGLFYDQQGDYDSALEWHVQAGRQGHVVSQNLSKSILLANQVKPKHEWLVFKWILDSHLELHSKDALLDAAYEGKAREMIYIGMMHFKGFESMHMDKVKGLAWLKLGAQTETSTLSRVYKRLVFIAEKEMNQKERLAANTLLTEMSMTVNVAQSKDELKKKGSTF